MSSEISIYNRDCMEAMKEMPEKSFDLAIVDPPYGLGLSMSIGCDFNKRGHRKNESIVKHKKKDWNNSIPSAKYFKELHRVSKHQIIWGCNYYAKYIKGVGRIVHDKQMGTEETEFKWSHADLASCSMFKRIVIFRYQWAGNKQNGTINWFNTGIDARIHPTQKPVALYSHILKKYAPPHAKILDTHLGSGSIAIACYNMGFDLTGFEIDKEYYEGAVKRIENHKKQLTFI